MEQLRKRGVRIAVFVVLLLGGKYVAENQAEKLLAVATELDQDREYAAALRKLRTIHQWFSWTPAGRQAEELREAVVVLAKGGNRRP